MDNKFVYQNEDEVQLIESQCEGCIFYNDGSFSSECPESGTMKIFANKRKCKKKHIRNILD